MKEKEAALTAHIDNVRLFNAAAGSVRLEDYERKHLHSCGVCQGVFYVFVSQQVSVTGSKSNPPAA
jgi:hypothetical protein